MSCFSASTFRSILIIGSILTFSPTTKANLEGDKWLFHLPEKSYEFDRSGIVRGTPYVCLPEIAKALKLNLEYDPLTFEVKLTQRKTKNQALFRTYSSDVYLDLNKNKSKKTIHIELSRRPEFINSQLCVPIEFGDRVLRPLFDSKNPSLPVFVTDERQLSKIKVILDPGHGGNDYGARANGSVKPEKDLVLLFAQELKIALENRGIGAMLTRESDFYTTLSERARMANQSPAKLFLSFHLNSSTQKKVNGFELYVLTLNDDDSQGRAAVAREHQMIPNDLPEGFEKAAADLRASANLESSTRWAEYLQSAIKTHIPASSSRPVRTAPFYVLYAAQMPALLVELGYITNSKDYERITNPQKRAALVQSMAKIIVSNLKEPLASP